METERHRDRDRDTQKGTETQRMGGRQGKPEARDRAIQTQAHREMNEAGFQRQTGREKRRTNHREK